MQKLRARKLAVAIVLFTVILSGCLKETSVKKTERENASELVSGASKPSSPKSTSSFGDYQITVSVSPDGQTWTYTIVRAKVNAKNLSHLIIDLNNCGDQSATFSDIISATVNGAPADLKPTEGSGTGCDPQSATTNFVKIGFTAATQWVVVITLDRGYETFTGANAWVKAGTSCNTGTIQAPGCPKEDYCSYSQGFFFSPGSYNNGASAFWANGLTVGGTTYSQANGTNFWDINTGKGSNQVMNAFFQLGAVRLSRVESEVAADAAIIDAYFAGSSPAEAINVINTITQGTFGNNGTFLFFLLPEASGGYTKAEVIAAGSRIGLFIEANHCVSESVTQ